MPKSSTSQRKNKSRTCERSPSPGLLQQLQAIVSRLNVLEDNSRLGSTSVATIGGQPVVESPGPAVGTIVSRAPSTSRTTCVTPPLPSVHASQVSANDSAAIEVADKIRWCDARYPFSYVCAVFFECDENESCSDDSIIVGPSHLRDVTIAERAGEGAPPSGEAVLAENAQE
ncbi:unnamed protein product, partial [Brenthis ino]